LHLRFIEISEALKSLLLKRKARYTKMSQASYPSNGKHHQSVRSVLILCLVFLLGASKYVRGDVAVAQVAQGGKRPEDIATHMQRVHEDVVNDIPPEAQDVSSNAAVVVEITDEDLEFVEEQQKNTTEIAHLGIGAADSPAVIGFTKDLLEVGTKKGNDRFLRGVLERTNRTDDGITFGFRWAFTVSSPGAKGLRLYIQDVDLPEGVELLVVNHQDLALGQADGPYHRHGPNRDTKAFWSRSLSGETQTVVVRAKGMATPDIVQGMLDDITFHITKVAYVLGQAPAVTRRQRRLRQLGSFDGQRSLVEDNETNDYWPCSRNGGCFEDPKCHETNAVIAHAMNAVAKLQWIHDGKIMSCTGTLIADTDETTENPLMVSASHCFRGNSFDNMEAFFYHTTDVCEGTCPGSVLNGHMQRTSDIVGMTLLRHDTALDYALLKLHLGGNSALPQGVVFLGWDANAVADLDGKPLYRLSTPNYGALVYTEHTVDVDQNYRCGMERGEVIHSKYVSGGTAFGSSGSALIDDEGKIVGTLMGKCGPSVDDSCATQGYRAIDSAFANFYPMIKEFLVVETTNPQCVVDTACTQDSDPCTQMACVSGECVKIFTEETCDTGDVCTTNDKCRQGICEPGMWTCDDIETCSTDDECSSGGLRKGKTCAVKECSSSGLCETVVMPDEAFCDDGDACTYGDKCSEGVCVSGQMLCATAVFSTGN
jgi:hypothetical protein